MRSDSGSASRLVFQGIDATTGLPLAVPTTTRRFAHRVLRRDPEDSAELERAHLAQWADRKEMGEDRRPAADVDPRKISSAGWGVIFPAHARLGVAALKRQLQPLLDHRQQEAERGEARAKEATRYYRCLTYGPGRLSDDFIHARTIPTGPADPKVLPYYLLLVGDADEIPTSFQYLLDVQYAIGRLAFDELEDYGRYAQMVVDVETENAHVVRPEMAFFSVRKEGDRATELSDKNLVGALREILRMDRAEWPIRRVPGSKHDLVDLLCGDRVPALLFTAAHGLAYRSGHRDQRDHQGDILCGEWRRGRAVQPSQRFGFEDLRDADLRGLVTFFFGCYSAGTPERDNFPPEALRNPRKVAPAPFFSKLAQTFLMRGALAVLGHVDRAWTCTFDSGESRGARHVESMVKYLLDGFPVGHAMDWMNERYAELAADLTHVLDPRREANLDLEHDAVWLTRTWRAHADARNFVVLGDPAVRIPVGPRRALSSETPAALSSSGPSLGRLREVLAKIDLDSPVRTVERPAQVLRRLRHAGDT